VTDDKVTNAMVSAVGDVNADPAVTLTRPVTPFNDNNMSFTEALAITPPRQAAAFTTQPQVTTTKSKTTKRARVSSFFKKTPAPHAVGITPTNAPSIVQRMRESTGRRASGLFGLKVTGGSRAPAGWRVEHEVLGDGTAVWEGEGIVKEAWKGAKGWFRKEKWDINVLH
jgi:hypothetical protein